MSKALYLADEFRPRAIIRGGIAMFTEENAIALIQEAHKRRIRILGIDTFRLTEKTTEPMLDHILDLSMRGFFADDGWDQCIKFIQTRINQQFHFEIVLGDVIELGARAEPSSACDSKPCGFRSHERYGERNHMTKALTAAILLMLAISDLAIAKSAGNRPYVATFGNQSPFYARCIPVKTKGSEGTTQILCLRERDEVVATYAWYNRNGIVMGWSPKVGKVAVMRVRQDAGLPAEKQIEFSFYLGDRWLQSYTTEDLVKLGAKVESDWEAIEDGLGVEAKRAAYRVEGCKQAWNTNDYYFSIRLDETRTLSFDILTGGLCRVEKDGTKQRLVQVENGATSEKSAEPAGGDGKPAPQP